MGVSGECGGENCDDGSASPFLLCDVAKRQRMPPESTFSPDKARNTIGPLPL